MAKIYDGGPAYPVLGNVAHNSDWISGYGMSLRDYFAACALPAVVAATSAGQHMLGGSGSIPERIAHDAYELADAMLKAREAAE